MLYFIGDATIRQLLEVLTNYAFACAYRNINCLVLVLYVQTYFKSDATIRQILEVLVTFKLKEMGKECLVNKGSR
jgi:hypothetical protein